jgi:Glycosyl transferase family 2
MLSSIGDSLSDPVSKRVAIYILSRNRPDYLRESLASVIQSADQIADITVSDNSTNNEVALMLQTEFPSVNRILRHPPLAALEHFNQLIKANQHEYFMLFHDDDVMQAGMVHELIYLLDSRPSAAACACNSIILQEENLLTKSLMGRFNKCITVSSANQLMSYYLQPGQTGSAAFPAYLYRTNMVKDLTLDASEGGKFADISFLLKVVKRGALIWSPHKLMHTRIHSANDSLQESIGERLRLLRYLFVYHGLSKHDTRFINFRTRMWLRWLVQNKNNETIRKRRIQKIVFTYAFKNSLKLVFSVNSWQRLLHRIF